MIERKPVPEAKLAAESSGAAKASRELWKGLVRFNREQAGPLRYTRKVLTVRDARARRRGSRLIHLNTFSFQAPGFYEKQGYQRFGGMAGSPKGESRHFYVKRLSWSRSL